MARKKIIVNQEHSSKPASWNYVYYKWNNFQEYEGDLQRILNQCHNDLLNNAIDKLSVPDVKKLEIEMNNRLNERIKAFKKLFLHKDPRSQTILQNMLNTFFTTKSSAWIAEVLTNLKWDDTLGQPVYTGSNFNLAGDKQKAKRAFLKPTKEFHYYTTMHNRVESLKKELDSYSSDVQKAVESNIKNIEDALNLIKPKTGNKVLHALHNGELTDQECQGLIDKINIIIDQLNGIDSINDEIGAKFAELMGHLIADTKFPQRMTKQAFDRLFKEFKQGGSSSTQKGLVIDPHFDLESIDWEDEILKDAKKEHTLVDKNGNRYSISNIAMSSTGKLDSKFTIQQNGQEKTFGVSIKNYNVFKEDLAGNIIAEAGVVSLQGKTTSLFAYLAGMEKNLGQAHLMQYHLNALSNLQGADSVLQGARKQAIENLKLHLMYSALTGYGQYKEGRNTELFAIYEKSGVGAEGGRIKLYSALDLIQDTSGVEISPSLDTLSFSNAPVGDPEKNPNIKEGFIRTERILAEARKKTYSISLKKSLLANKLQKY